MCVLFLTNWMQMEVQLPYMVCTMELLLIMRLALRNCLIIEVSTEQTVKSHPCALILSSLKRLRLT